MSKIPSEILQYFKDVDQGWRSDGTKDKSRVDGKLDQQEIEYAQKKHFSIHANK